MLYSKRASGPESGFWVLATVQGRYFLSENSLGAVVLWFRRRNDLSYDQRKGQHNYIQANQRSKLGPNLGYVRAGPGLGVKMRK